MNPYQPKSAPYNTLIVEARGETEWVTLNRPESLNAMNPELMLELQDYFAALRYRHQVRIVVLKGAGRAFCAGYDFSPEHGVDSSSAPEGMRIQNRVAEIIKLMKACPQPIISLVQGAACGGGFAMALASDIRIGAPDAKMNAAFIRIGLSGCDVGVSYLLPRLIGASVAAELLMTGRFLLAERAERLGLFSKVVPQEQLDSEAEALIAEMLRTTPMALRLTKEALNVNVDAAGLAAAIALEDRQQILCATTEDHLEAMAAFKEKREPQFNDR